MRVLITGDKGFLGAETKKILENKAEIISYDLMDGQDIRNIKNFREVVREVKPTRILHLAAIARFSEADRDPKLANEINVYGTRNVVSVAKEFNVPLIYASTGSVYMPITADPPITEEFNCSGNSMYACTKYLGELYVREHTPYMILRYAHLYGSEKRGHGLIAGFLERIERGLAPQLHGGSQSNDFTYVKDAARANLLALFASWDKWNQIYNIGTGEELTVKQAGEMICKAAGYKGEIEIKKGREVDPSKFVYDISKAKLMLGYESKYSFKEGLSDMFSKRKVKKIK